MSARGAEGGGVDFSYFMFSVIGSESNEFKGIPNVSIIKHSNENNRSIRIKFED